MNMLSLKEIKRIYQYKKKKELMFKFSLYDSGYLNTETKTCLNHHLENIQFKSRHNYKLIKLNSKAFVYYM